MLKINKKYLDSIRNGSKEQANIIILDSDEYSSSILVISDNIKQVSEKIININGAIIHFPDSIISIEPLNDNNALDITELYELI